MKKYIFLILIFLYIWNDRCIAQQPGDLDISFGGGKVSKPNAPWYDVAVQTDGNILVVRNIIARYKTDGTLDSSFGNNGIVTIKVDSASSSYCSAIDIQPDGKILVTGVTIRGNAEDMLLARYNTDGSIDSSFDGDGIVVTDFNSGDDHGYVLAIQADGRIVVAGADDLKFAISRYHSNGTLDSTFDYDGKVVINNINLNLSNNPSHPIYMKLQADGRILMGSAFLTIRVNSNGSQDNSFGTSGVLGLVVPMNDLVIQPDGKIVFAGGQSNFSLVRIDTSGNFDNSFGNGGNVTTSGYTWGCSNPGHKATSITLQPDGRILAGGYNWCCVLGDCREFVLIRYNPDGSLDSSFSSDGKVTTDFWLPNSSESHASAITPDLKIVLAGYSLYQDYGAIARYHIGPMLDVDLLSDPGNRLIVAPNPTTGLLNLEAAKIENGVWNLDIVDQTGRSMYHEAMTITNKSFQKKISLKPFPDGLYFLKMTGANQRMVYRIAKGE